MKQTRWQTLVAVALITAAASPAWSDPPFPAAKPQVVVISLDGAKPDLIRRYLNTGALDKKTGLGRLAQHGIVADQNITATPSLTAVSHIAIATGSTSAHNDIPANTFHPVGASIGTTISGFAAPIGGYVPVPVIGPNSSPTAEPLWVSLRKAGKSVVTATWPGGDGATISIAGKVVQDAVPTRTVDYTVPFGAFGGVGAVGFQLTAAQFTAVTPEFSAQLANAGVVSHSSVRVTAAAFETVFCAPVVLSTPPCGTNNGQGRSLRYDMFAAALDTTADGQVNYDTLVIFALQQGIRRGPFPLPSTGPAYVQIGGLSARFFYEGSGSKVGTAFFVSYLDPALATVRFARYSANFIPRNTPVLADVDDINEHVGFWGAQPDFRIPERMPAPAFAAFPDPELESMYLDQVATFVPYQTAVALRAIALHPLADLVMIYIEQPDGSGHQWTLTDPRQASNPADNRTFGRPGQPTGATGQDPDKVARYATYLQFAYQAANAAVEAILNAVGSRPNGEPLRDVLVVSDHGMAPFHTAVNMNGLLTSVGFDLTKISARTSGPAANIYVNLAGRESGGTVGANEYAALVSELSQVLGAVKDPNAFYNPGARPLFGRVWVRPSDCKRPGFCTDAVIGQDTGDVLALLDEGYNFDGTQNPVVPRLGDAAPLASVYSVPNFYGAHGHDSSLPSMSAILFVAGPSFKQGNHLGVVHSIDIAPTVLKILGVEAPATVDGAVIPNVLHKQK